MTGLTRSVNYRPMQGPVTSMADSEKNGGLPNGAEVVSKFTDPTGSENEHRCRWGSCSPACCQTFRRAAWFLFCLCWAGAIQGMVVNGFINVVISTVERRFEISSTESGTIASCYDIAAVLCLIPVSYFGSRGCKPVYLAVGMMVMALGSFVFSLPHFTTSLYQMESAKHALCTAKDNVTNCDATSSTELSNYKFVFFLGQLLHGAGASPLYTLGTTYLDDNLPVKSASLYQGIFYACAIFGPGIGYLAGGAFLNFYTDFDQIDKSSLSINKDNPRWVGAWWIGFLISSFAAFVISLPLFGFPKSLPGCEQYIAEKEKEVYSGGASGKAIEKEALGMRHILTSVRMLLSNPTFMFLNLAAACEGAVLSGFSTFAPKFIEFQFSLTSDVSAQYIALSGVIRANDCDFHRYADDTELSKSAPLNEFNSAQSLLESCIDDVSSWMNSNKLKLNTDKTEVMPIASSSRLRLIGGNSKHQ